MEIKLKAGYKINIPENCELIVENNILTVKEKEFKDGDILSVATTSNNKPTPFIYKSTDKEGFHKFYVGIDCCDDVFICPDDDARWCHSHLRYATEEEKQHLFDKLKEMNLHWNPETKELKKIRLRVDEKEEYLFISDWGVVCSDFDQRRTCDNMRWNIGNYYLLEHRIQAYLDAKAVRAIYEKKLKIK